MGALPGELFASALRAQPQREKCARLPPHPAHVFLCERARWAAKASRGLHARGRGGLLAPTIHVLAQSRGLPFHGDDEPAPSYPLLFLPVRRHVHSSRPRWPPATAAANTKSDAGPTPQAA